MSETFDTKMDRITNKLEILTDQIGHLTKGLTEIKLLVQQQAEVDKERKLNNFGTFLYGRTAVRPFRRQNTRSYLICDSKQQAEAVKQQPETVNHQSDIIKPLADSVSVLASALSK